MPPNVVAKPIITSFLPLQGAKGSTVVLVGTNFLGATQVSLNSGAVASFHIDSDKQLTVVLTNANVTGKWRVTTAGGTGVSENDFIVQTTPLITNITLASSSFWFNKGDTAMPNGGLRHDDFAQAVVDVTAPGKVTLSFSSNAYGGAIFKDGVYYDTIPAGANSYSTILSAIGRYSFMEGPQARNNEQGDIQYTSLLGASFSDGAVARLVPWLKQSKAFVILGDSVSVRAGASRLDKGWSYLVQQNSLGFDWYSVGYSSKQGWFDFYSDAARAITVAALKLRYENVTDKRLILAYGINDQYHASGGVLATAWATEQKKLLLAIYSAIPDIKIYLLLPHDVNDGRQNGNANGQSQEDYRVATRNSIADITNFVLPVETKYLISIGAGDITPDNIHPNDQGHAKLAAGIMTVIQNSTFPAGTAVQAGTIRANNGELGKEGGWIYGDSEQSIMYAGGPAKYFFKLKGGQSFKLLDTYRAGTPGFTVNIDGIIVETVSTKGADNDLDQPFIVYTSPMLAGGDAVAHTITVSNIGSAANDYLSFYGIQVLNADNSIGTLTSLSASTTTQYAITDSSRFSFTNGWGYGGESAYTNDSSQYTTITFTGTQIVLLAGQAPDGDDFLLTLDGGNAIVRSGVAPQSQVSQPIYDSGVLTTGTHALVVRKNNTNNGYIALQGIRVTT